MRQDIAAKVTRSRTSDSGSTGFGARRSITMSVGKRTTLATNRAITKGVPQPTSFPRLTPSRKEPMKSAKTMLPARSNHSYTSACKASAQMDTI